MSSYLNDFNNIYHYFGIFFLKNYHTNKVAVSTNIILAETRENSNFS